MRLLEDPGWELVKRRKKTTNKQQKKHSPSWCMITISSVKTKTTGWITNASRLASIPKRFSTTLTSHFSLEAVSQQKLGMKRSPPLNSSLQAWHAGFTLLPCSRLMQENKLYKEMLVLSSACGFKLLELRAWRRGSCLHWIFYFIYFALQEGNTG